MIELNKFCANERDPRAHLQAPFELDGYVYATNGHLLVRVPAAEHPGHVAYVLGKHPSNIKKLTEEAFADEGHFQPLPDLPLLLTCPTCLGSGIWPAHLQEDPLDGDEDCWECGGSGKQKNPQAIGDSLYALHYLHLLNELPNLQIAARGSKNPAAMTFDGGQALLMPVRA